MKALDVVAAVLLVVGGLNWGLVGLFRFDLVATIFGGQTACVKWAWDTAGAAQTSSMTP